MRRVLDLLREPLLDGLDVDGEGRLALHRKILKKKRVLREVFTEFHHLFRKLDLEFLSGTGTEIELGAGISPMRDSYPEVLATDVVCRCDAWLMSLMRLGWCPPAYNRTRSISWLPPLHD